MGDVQHPFWTEFLNLMNWEEYTYIQEKVDL